MTKGLGKGVSALFANIDVANIDNVGKSETVQEIRIKDLRTNPYQPRKIFDEQSLEELTKSVTEHGILQPIIARKSIKGYEIVVGERRFRAAKAAKLDTVPVVVRELNEQQMMELSVLENLQREDLTPVEEARAYEMLITRLNLTQEELAVRLGKSRPYIANHLRLLSLPANIQKLMTAGEISMGHGRTLLSLHDKEKITPIASKVIKENLNVRQLEKLVQQINENVPRETIKKGKDIFIQEYEHNLCEKFGTSVKIKQTNKKGKIEIEFMSKQDLERILDIIGSNTLS